MSDEQPPVPNVQVNDLALSLLLSRLDTQDKSLEFILREARKTNGRVTALEQRNAQADKDEADEQKQDTQQRDTRRFWVQVLSMLVAGAAGSGAAALFHL